MAEKEMRHGGGNQQGKRCGKLLFKLNPRGLEIRCHGCKELVTVQYMPLLEAIMSALVDAAPRPDVEKAAYIVSRLLEEE